MLEKYGKALLATLGAVAMSVYVVTTDDIITPLEWIVVSQSWLAAVAVYIVPLAPQYRWGKTAVGAMFAGSAALALAIPGGVDGHEWIGIIIAVGSAAGIAGMTSRSDNGISSKAYSPRGADAGPPPAL